MEPITHKIIEAVKARYHLLRHWQGRPGYLGFGLLGLGSFICGIRGDNGLGLLFITAVVAFVAEGMRLLGGKA